MRQIASVYIEQSRENVRIRFNVTVRNASAIHIAFKTMSAFSMYTEDQIFTQRTVFSSFSI